MLPIGGELALEQSHLNYFFTDSGRSSLRLFCRNFKDQKFLIPNFLCKVIVDVLIENEIEFDFYHVGTDFEIDLTEIKKKSFDVLYVINYFGSHHDALFRFDLDDKTLVEDNVFFVDFDNIYGAKQWFGFNSFRKITTLPEGSLVKTNLQILDHRIHQQAPYVVKKYQAKHLKFIFREYNQGLEYDFLKLFNEAEEELGQQDGIYAMSDHSLALLLSCLPAYEKEKKIREDNFRFLQSELREHAVNIKLSEYSFFVFRCAQRDELRSYLFLKNIFLPIHWAPFNLENQLYHELLSIPLFSIYHSENLKFVSNCIKGFFNAKH